MLNKLMTVQLAICAHTLLNLEKFLKISSQVLLKIAQSMKNYTILFIMNNVRTNEN